jgi:dolichol-phosphate mannosyltransferase
MPPEPELTIVMPAYNEGPGIERVVNRVQTAIGERLDTVEVVIVDDHSSDETGAILERLAAQDGRITVYRAVANRGHGPSVRRGLDASHGEWIFQMDSDTELAPDDFWRLWAARADADLVSGYRQRRREARHRLALTRLEQAFVRRLARSRSLRDVNAPFKLLRRELWTDLRPAIPPNCTVPSIMLILGAALRDRRIVQLPVTQPPRLAGESSLRPWKLAKLCVRATGELVAFRARLTRRG